jgi:hypothetical protein
MTAFTDHNFRYTMILSCANNCFWHRAMDGNKLIANIRQDSLCPMAKSLNSFRVIHPNDVEHNHLGIAATG